MIQNTVLLSSILANQVVCIFLRIFANSAASGNINFLPDFVTSND